MLSTIKRHPASSITAFFAFCGYLIPFIAQFQDLTAPFGVKASVWFTAATVLAAAVVVGQMWQAILPIVPVSWGIPSILGFLGAAAALITPMIASLSDSLAPLNVPQDVWVKAGAALTLVTLIGRIYQATGGHVGPPPIPEPVPTGGGADEPAV